MAVKATGSIQYAKATKVDTKAEVEVQGMVKIAKGMFDLIGVVAWETSWRFFDPYGKLLYRDDRSHSIMPFTRYDEATDNLKVKLPYHSYYQVQLYGPVPGVLDTEVVRTSAVPIVRPAPEPPTFPGQEPEPPPTLPETPTPTPDGDKKSFDWTWLAVGAVVILALATTGKKGR